MLCRVIADGCGVAIDQKDFLVPLPHQTQVQPIQLHA